jgi:CPA2 family monovalent cation:H+ antiporter-2
MLATHSLLLLGVPLNRVLMRIRAIREERYSLFRGFFHGASDMADAAENLQPRLHSVLLPEGANAIGRALSTLELRSGVEITGVRRKGARSQRPRPDWVFEPGDVVILLGRPEGIALAEQRLLEG